tara:strand:- start:229 stop:666 length:438 start_codon:yes stop_codon:yes gene_type:complete
MKNEFDSIDDALEVSAEIIPTKEIEKKPTRTSITKPKGDSPEIQKDYEYSRAQLYSLIEKGQEAVDGILEVAQESESARSYEVAGQLIKHVADTADKLMDLQKKVKDIEEVGNKSTASQVTNNSLFVGSTAELQKMLKQTMKDAK